MVPLLEYSGVPPRQLYAVLLQLPLPQGGAGSIQSGKVLGKGLYLCDPGESSPMLGPDFPE